MCKLGKEIRIDPISSIDKNHWTLVLDDLRCNQRCGWIDTVLTIEQTNFPRWCGKMIIYKSICWNCHVHKKKSPIEQVALQHALLIGLE